MERRGYLLILILLFLQRNAAVNLFNGQEVDWRPVGKQDKRSRGEKNETIANDLLDDAIDKTGCDSGTEEPSTVSKNISIAKVLTAYKIVPEILSSPPQNGIQITYGPNKTVFYGNFLLQREVEYPPVELYWEADSAEFYTLIMLASYVPPGNSSVQREWLQWLIGNIPGNTWGGGEVLAEYIFPLGGGVGGMYMFFVFKQRNKIEYEKKFHGRRASGVCIQPTFLRPFFSIKNFTRKFKLGDALAVNFFQIKPRAVYKKQSSLQSTLTL